VGGDAELLFAAHLAGGLVGTSETSFVVAEWSDGWP
jgi:hypothetical protein